VSRSTAPDTAGQHSSPYSDALVNRFDKLDDRLRHVETKAEVLEATMLTWKRLAVVLAAVVASGATLFGLVVTLGDRLWGG
jgi:hypothetical protein